MENHYWRPFRALEAVSFLQKLSPSSGCLYEKTPWIRMTGSAVRGAQGEERA